jgi:hypothetical protein
MVNAKFPEPGSMWFRKGGRADVAASRQRGINGKFTANQIDGVFLKFSAI